MIRETVRKKAPRRTAGLFRLQRAPEGRGGDAYQPNL